MISQTGGGMEIFMEKKYFVYLLKCSDQSLYCGYTDDVEKRLKVHNSGKGAKHTKSRLPAELVYFEELEDKSQALRREMEIKKLPRRKKIELIKKNPNLT